MGGACEALEICGGEVRVLRPPTERAAVGSVADGAVLTYESALADPTCAPPSLDDFS